MTIIIKNLILATLLLGVTSVMAQPPGKGDPLRKYCPLKTAKDFAAVEQGDKVGLVCLQCHTITELSVEDEGDAELLCKEGNKVYCPVCKKTYTSVRRGLPGSKGHIHRKVTYVNSKGVECAFITTLNVKDKDEHKQE